MSQAHTGGQNQDQYWAQLTKKLVLLTKNISFTNAKSLNEILNTFSEANAN